MPHGHGQHEWVAIDLVPRRYRCSVGSELAMLSHGVYNVYRCGRSGCGDPAVSAVFRIFTGGIEARMVRCIAHTGAAPYEVGPDDIVIT